MPHAIRLGAAAAAMAAMLGPVMTGSAAPSAAAAPVAPAAGGRVPIAGTHPGWAIRARRITAGPATTGTVSLRVYLAGRDPAGLTAYAARVSAPGSALYRRFLSPEQAMARFGPTPAEVAGVRSWLSSSGLTITSGRVSHAAGAFIAARGPLMAAGRAFAVTFGVYRGPDGRLDRAPTATATAPAAVAGSVLAVDGLDTARHIMVPALPPPGPGSPTAPPCAGYYGQKIAAGKPAAAGRHWPWALCGYVPRQIRGAYQVTVSGMTGLHQTVAIVDAYRSPTMLADANRYAKLTRDPPFAPGQYRQFQAGPFTLAGPHICNAPHWYGEQSLDVEALHGEAPAALVRYVAAGSCQNPDLANAVAFVVNRHLASIVSDSWGVPAQDATLSPVFDAIFQLGITEGIGFFFSTGDSGYNSPLENSESARIQVQFPASDPWVTSVGGTSLAVGIHRTYEFETGWGTLADQIAPHGEAWSLPPPGKYPAGYGGSGGGGVSTVYAQPFYQRSVVPVSTATHLPDGTISPRPMRVIPDVSAVADPATGFLVGQTTLLPDGSAFAFTLSRVGGTSLACPTVAGIEADAQQAAGHPLGFANPAIYARAGTAAFHDVTDHPLGPGQLYLLANQYAHPVTRRGSFTLLVALGINGEGTSALRAVTGYDDETGVGSPDSYIRSFVP